jgi:hypothetical protein
MKLTSVVFKHLVTVPGHGTSADFMSPPVPIEYDKATDMVRVGNDPVDVPRSDVAQWKRDRVKESGKVTCPECQRQFNNPQALGAHRRFKHEESAA